MHRRILFAAPAVLVKQKAAFEPLEDGLDLGVFDAPVKSSHGDSKITVLRVDPAKLRLVLLCASMAGEENRTARAWGEKHGLLAVTNAAMFHPDGRGTGLMRTAGHVNNATKGKDKATLVFDPKEASLPPVAILDADCDGDRADRYGSAVQSIRMVTCKRKNVWSQQPRKWSHAVVGIDSSGRPLLVHARSPWSTHDFTNMLLQLPIDLARLQYAEGGPEASLWISAGNRDLFGSYETGFVENDDNAAAWPIPNVLGVKRR